MSFQRQSVCFLTNIPVERFKTLARRDQLPTLPDQIEDRDGERRQYSDLDVLAIAVAERLWCQIGYAEGLLPGPASKIVGNALGGLDNILFSNPRSDQWIGYVGQPSERGGSLGGYNVAGSLAEIFAAIRAANDEAPSERVFLINVSEVFRAIRMRAEKHGIQYPSDSE